MCIAARKAKSAVPLQEHSSEGLSVGNETATVEPDNGVRELSRWRVELEV